MLKIFKDPPSVETREPVEQVHLDNTMVELMDYKNEQIEGYCYYAQLVGLFCPKEDGAYDFGLTVYGTGKLFVNGQLIINNAEHQTPGDSFFGAGTKEELGTVNLCAGEKAHICVEFGTAPMQSTIALGTTNMGAGGFRLGCAKEIDPEVELDRAVQLAKEVDQVIICAGLNVSQNNPIVLL